MSFLRMSLSLWACFFFFLASPFARAEGSSYRSHIVPIMEARCLTCHGSDSPEYPEFKSDPTRYIKAKKGPRMDSYTHLVFFVAWPDTGAIMRRLDDGQNTKDGKPGNMYKYLGDTEQERQKHLAIFKSWIGSWTLKRWFEVTKEEIDAMRLSY